MKNNTLLIVIIALVVGLAIGWYMAGSNTNSPTAFMPSGQNAVGSVPPAFLTGAIGGVCSSNADCGLYEICEDSSCTDASDFATPREVRMGAITLPIPAAEYNEMLQSDGFIKVECPDGQNGIEMIMAHPFKDPCWTIQ